MKCSGIHKEQSDNAVTKTHVSLNIIEAALVISIVSNTPLESNVELKEFMLRPFALYMH